ncbi:unnamed protein product [Rotaria sordida]|uniref:UDP-N-acetylglucosamine--peptide N-acetylglucosaminyltransferase SPINDLY n=1 Tax=Rotaria sordida TaxID=392033 RepID=A0A814NHC2_9BILA|nr:unnamed protein product [Rotaria sordida]CAF1092931.1 unnamed protein product [Rotaria sordida]
MSRRQRLHVAEGYVVVWVDENIDMTNEDCKNTMVQLREVVNQVQQCTTPDQCIQLLNESQEEISFVISSGAIGQHLVPTIHDMTKLNAIFIFCGNKQQHKEWTQNYAKIKGVHTSIKHICEKLKMAIKQCNQDNIPVSIVSLTEGGSSKNLDQLEPTFMYSQIFKEILLEIEHDQNAIQDLVTYCQQEYKDNNKELKIIHEFQREYQASNAIWWYTRECFTYKMLNAALRTLNGDIMIRMGFFLCDIHRQIEHLHKEQAEELYMALLEQASNDSGKAYIYHMLGMMKNGKGQYTEAASFYEMSLRIKRKALPEDHPSLANTYNNIGGVYHNMGDYSKAVEFYKQAIKIKEKALPPNDPDLALSYNNIGGVYKDMGDYSKALEFYEKALKIREKALPSNHPDLATCYSSIGQVYHNMGDYSKALEFYEKAHKIYEKALPPNHPNLATSYNNIGRVYNDMGDYSKALEFYEKAHQIYEKILPSNHPHLAASYNSIGLMYNGMGDYSKALESYEKAHKILEKALPSNHPHFASSYNNIGLVYKNMGDYSKALEFYEKALKIDEKALPSNHPHVASSYNNIGQVYDNMGDYLKALEFYEKALKIKEKALPPNHPSLATSYNNIDLPIPAILVREEYIENIQKNMTN